MVFSLVLFMLKAPLLVFSSSVSEVQLLMGSEEADHGCVT